MSTSSPGTAGLVAGGELPSPLSETVRCPAGCTELCCPASALGMLPDGALLWEASFGRRTSDSSTCACTQLQSCLSRTGCTQAAESEGLLSAHWGHAACRASQLLPGSRPAVDIAAGLPEDRCLTYPELLQQACQQQSSCMVDALQAGTAPLPACLPAVLGNIQLACRCRQTRTRQDTTGRSTAYAKRLSHPMWPVASLRQAACRCSRLAGSKGAAWQLPCRLLLVP